MDRSTLRPQNAPSGVRVSRATGIATGSAIDVDSQVPAERHFAHDVNVVEGRLQALEDRFDALSRRIDSFGIPATTTIPSVPSPEALGTLPLKMGDAGSVTLQKTETACRGSGSNVRVCDDTLRPPRIPGEFEGHVDPKGDEPHCSGGAAQSGGPMLRGTLNGVSLGTLFSLLEYEHCDGLLALSRGPRTMLLTFHLGAIVRCELDGALTSALVGIRTVCDWSTATFSFRGDALDDEKEGPHSGNALMLEALRHRDERARASSTGLRDL